MAAEKKGFKIEIEYCRFKVLSCGGTTNFFDRIYSKKKIFIAF